MSRSGNICVPGMKPETRREEGRGEGKEEKGRAFEENDRCSGTDAQPPHCSRLPSSRARERESTESMEQ